MRRDGSRQSVDPKEELAAIYMSQAPSPIRAYYRKLVKQLVTARSRTDCPPGGHLRVSPSSCPCIPRVRHELGPRSTQAVVRSADSLNTDVR